MSRTYRSLMKSLDCNCGAPIYQGWKYNENYYIRKDSAPFRDCQHHFYDYYSRHNVKRDHKNWAKPGRVYKTIMKKRRKAKERSAMQKKDYDKIPIFHKEDRRNYL